jgi:hypothetical protein
MLAGKRKLGVSRDRRRIQPTGGETAAQVLL